MNYEQLQNFIAECDELAERANDRSIREKSAELADMYRQLAEAAKRRELGAHLEVA